MWSFWKAEGNTEREIGPICGAIKKVHDYSDLGNKTQEELLFEVIDLFQILTGIIEEELGIL